MNFISFSTRWLQCAASVAFLWLVSTTTAVASGEPASIAVRETMHQGQPSVEIRAPRAIWTYHREGAGFASLQDVSGFEWIGYRPGSGPAGEYRGIPNLTYRTDNAVPRFFHPGFAGDRGARTDMVAQDETRVVLRSVSQNEKWKLVWEILADRARLTVLENDPADPAFWFLFEGTPGGRLDAADFCLRSTGERTALSESWDDTAARARWVAFVCPSLNRALLIVAPDLLDAVPVSYWPMQDAMTVFGFGRKIGSTENFLTKVPATFLVALVESADVATLRTRAEALVAAAQ